MKISSAFDSGNIEVINAEDPANIQLKIRKDSNSDFLQWFHFRLQGQRNTPYVMNIINAGEASYAKGWEGYRPCVSYDKKNWFRIPGEYDGKTLTIRHTPEYESVYYAYFVPFSYERHLELLGMAQNSPLSRIVPLCNTVDGRDLDLLVVGNESAEKKVWVIARQHPGETMAEWFMEGMIERLLDQHDPISKSLLKKCVFYIVPNMNPDGSIRGNLRSNAAGANLNREWLKPSIEKSPEVYYVRRKMHETGVDLALDIHGDEDLPYNFVATCEGNPSYNEKLKNLEDTFIDHLMSVNPDFQNEFHYEKGKFHEEQLKLATNYLGETFKCLALTLEMPFKDNANAQDEKYGWSPDRSIRLGRSILNAINFVLK
jgi:murein tripeptide amidase MpaA